MGWCSTGRTACLVAACPPRDVADDALWAALSAAMERQAVRVLARLDGPPQTNEYRRTAALCPGFLTVAARTGLPLVTSEVGAGAGLNLNWDRFFYRFGREFWGDPLAPVRIEPDWRGPPPPLGPVELMARAGCDRQPPGLATEADRRWLLSFIWADQSDRIERTSAAIDLARSLGVEVGKADAGDWLDRRLAAVLPGRAHVAYHSIVWQYLGEAGRARCLGLLHSAGARATKAAPLAWLRLEADGNRPGAAISLTLWPGGETRVLGRADFHGAWVDWTGWT